MKRLFLGSTFVAGTLLAVVMFASFAFSTTHGRFEPAVQAAEFCNAGAVEFKVRGSTTVGEVLQPYEGTFETHWSPDMQLGIIGSTAGINELTAGTTEVAPSSRPLSGAEIVGKFSHSIAFDEFVMVVSTHSDMTGLNDISVSQLAQIWGAGAGITTLEWDALSPPITFTVSRPTAKPIPQMRSTASGSRGDFNGQIGVSNTTENNTYVALGGDAGSYPRNLTALDQAESVANGGAEAVNNGIDQIAYTSLKDGVDQPVAGTRALTVGGVTASQATIFSGYPLPRELFLATRDLALEPRLGFSEMVRADDFVNWWRGWDKANADSGATGAGGFIATEGMVPRAKAAVPPIPDWDVSMTGGTGLGDIGQIIQKWGLSTTCNGWIRADANNNASVGLTDIGIVVNHWGQPGFICVSGAVCPN